jgi:uracil-DNA glycosylase family 4
MAQRLRELEKAITQCEACPRLRKHCQKMAQEKRKAYQDQSYWGRPIPGFGDPRAKVWVIGLAPAAHGANRTGRVFTGDRSGDWLYRALHKSGFANQPTSIHRDDGLTLQGAWISCVARCAPPDNKPLPAELERCANFLRQELEILSQVQVFIALGQIALHGLWRLLAPGSPRPRFAHGAEVRLPDGRLLLMSYHPSQQNTFTGRLTEPMFDSVFKRARELTP